MLTDSHKNAFYTLFHMDRVYRPADRLLCNGERLALGDEAVRVIHTPGHSKGSVCYLCNDEFLITGDTLFADAYGRYDLHGGSLPELAQSLASLRLLPQSLRIYPGHGSPEQLGIALDLVAYHL
jgi:glyoxylase-like metal-dependent hydrolase (beta-lactamase superfamily II)